MSKLRKRKNLNPKIHAMERKEAKEARQHSKTMLTEKVRKKLNEAYDPGIRTVIKKIKKRKQQS